MTQALLAAWTEARDLLGRDAGVLERRRGEGWTVLQHLDHLSRALRGSVAAAARIHEGGGGAPGDPSRGAREILESGRIPRGTASAPERTRPGDPPDPGDVRARLDRTRAQLAGLPADGEPSGRRIDHPMLGPLSADQWLRFATVHARHHLDIIQDLLDDPPAG